MKYLIVTGGTLSGLGKGTCVTSIGVVLKCLGIRLTVIKIDPYLNMDAGTMSPFEHGEVFVLEDGGEVDLDLGNYERWLDITLTRDHNITTGKVYHKIMCNERKGMYLGKTVQIVPHVIDLIQEWIRNVAQIPVDGVSEPPDVCLIEVGGTVGDIESGMYLEALQQFQQVAGAENVSVCHLSYVPEIGFPGQQKTKPTQHSVQQLRKAGLRPNFIVLRSKRPIEELTRDKIVTSCQVASSSVISLHDTDNIYDVPVMLESQFFGKMICKTLELQHSNRTPSISLEQWNKIARRVDEADGDVTIGIVGKYSSTVDTYLSVVKALEHASIDANVKLRTIFIEATDLEEGSSAREKYDVAWSLLRSVDGVICPGGFGVRGIRGYVLCAQYCRENNLPYLGICLGMQTALIEFCRNRLKLEDANSQEFYDRCEHPVVVLIPKTTTEVMGGTMRAGLRTIHILDSNSLACKLYDGNSKIEERHRHRYEVNPEYIPLMEEANMSFPARDATGTHVEIAELKNHRFYILTQYHPEFTSKILRPNPLYLGLILESTGELHKRFNQLNQRLCPGASVQEHINGSTCADSTRSSIESS